MEDLEPKSFVGLQAQVPLEAHTRFLTTWEAKKGYNVTLEDLWRPKSDFYKFIKQASKDGKFAKKPWLLIYKKDRKKEIVVCIDPFPLQEIILVKGKYYVYLLEDVLELDDSKFLDLTLQPQHEPPKQ